MIGRLMMVILLATSVPSPAFAQETPCLQGDAVDQRALSDLRAVVEAECPCDSYDGTSGARRGDYERCAVGVVEDAAARGALRAACVTAGLESVLAATCGTRSVACARTTPGGAPLFSCSIKREGACRDRSAAARLVASRRLDVAGDGPRRVRSPRSAAAGFAERVCNEQTHCADVLEWTAGTCFDVRQEGPYEPGVRVLPLTRPSSIDGEPRLLETAVWYPAPPGSGERDSMYGAVRDAPVDLSSGAHPVVLFSHGSCGFERQSLFLTPWLASHGFVVVAPPHPGNTLFEFPSCGTPPAQSASAVERPDDMVFVLDAVLAHGDDPDSPLAGALDGESIAMTGHSFGGYTTFLTTERDPRIKAAVAMAAAAGPTFRFDVPSLTLLGEVDSVVDNAANVAAFERSVRPKWLVEIRNTGHYAFSDGCFPSPDCEPPSVLEQDESHERVRRWVLPFLEVFLAGDLAFAPFLADEAGPSFRVDLR